MNQAPHILHVGYLLSLFQEKYFVFIILINILEIYEKQSAQTALSKQRWQARDSRDSRYSSYSACTSYAHAIPRSIDVTLAIPNIKYTAHSDGSKTLARHGVVNRY